MSNMDFHHHLMKRNHTMLQCNYTFPGGGSEAVEELGEGEGFGG